MTDPSHLLLNPKTSEAFKSFVRVEGTCTEKKIYRFYYDIMIGVLENDQTLWCQSKSSVLNGCVEGPFFEEALKNLKVLRGESS